MGATTVDEGFVAEEDDLTEHELSERILKKFLRSVTSSDRKQRQ